MHLYQDIDWQALYNDDFFSAGTCWTTCDSYCCKFNHVDAKGTKGVSLPLFPGEHLHFQAIGGIKNIDDPVKERKYTLPDGTNFSTYFLTCKCVGLCTPNEQRPLICRFYPYLPVVNGKGEILGFDYSALTDVFYDNPNLNHPCTLVREQPGEVQSELRKSLPKLLQYPQFVFTFMAANLLTKFLRESLGTTIDGMEEEEKKAFYKKYQWAVFTGQPWRNKAFGQAVQEAYEEVKAHFGEFEL